MSLSKKATALQLEREQLYAELRIVQQERDTLRAQQAEPAEQQAAWVEQVMDQAQVFASAWALVGGPFDTGNGLEQAEEEKERLRALLGGKA